MWWQKGVIYQIYPRSFMDSNGDGIGDIRGVISKLGYLKWLGVDALWLTPINPSPMKDFGYDISNYCDVHPLFGSMKDFDELLAEVHQMGLKLILDFVPNHTSSEHPWFIESKQSRSNSKKDWYIWKDPNKEGGPPNNWLSNFGGPAWTYEKSRGQYYYHAFLTDQPDLNWRNEEVQEAMFSSMRYWLDKGVDGFRVDVIWHIIKDEEFRDNPHSPEYEPHLAPHRKLTEKFNSDQPEVHEIIEKMRHVLDRYQERMMVGEIYLPMERLMAYYGSEGKGVHLPFNFHLFQVPWTPREISSVVENYEASLPEFGWPNWVLGNHDNHRLASRIGGPQIRIAAMLLLGLRGTPTIYYGEEIGMHDVHIPNHLIQDPFEKNVPGLGLGRDPERTPMQWNDKKNSGFTDGSPWLPLAEDFEENNVEKQIQDPNSTLQFYRELIKLRKTTRALFSGDYQKIKADDKIFAFLRKDRVQQYLIVLNFCSTECLFELENFKGEIILSTTLNRSGKVQNNFILAENEGVIIFLDELKSTPLA